MDFTRYLLAKRSVDDRSLNRWVYQQLVTALAETGSTIPLTILEVGCGLGTMLHRLWDWRLTPRAVYIALDREPSLIGQAPHLLQNFACHRGLTCEAEEGGWRLSGDGQMWLVTFQTQDILSMALPPEAGAGVELLLAHAVLDLLDLEGALPRLLGCLRPGGLYYFTLNYDGETIFAPPLDPAFEATILSRYHQGMGPGQGERAGHSQTGRRLLQVLCQSGNSPLAAGSSDWLVWPRTDGRYPAEEAYFLHCILDFVAAGVSFAAPAAQARFQAWLAQRRRQIDAGELIFLAHQLDVLGRCGRPPAPG